MHVVAAGVHHRLLHARDVDLLRARGVRKARSFEDGQSVHVRAQHHGRPLAVLQNRDETRSTDLLRHVVAETVQLYSESLGGLHLEKGELGIAVEVQEQLFEVVVVVLGDRVPQRFRRDRHGNAQCDDDQRCLSNSLHHSLPQLGVLAS